MSDLMLNAPLLQWLHLINAEKPFLSLQRNILEQGMMIIYNLYIFMDGLVLTTLFQMIGRGGQVGGGCKVKILCNISMWLYNACDRCDNVIKSTKAKKAKTHSLSHLYYCEVCESAWCASCGDTTSSNERKRKRTSKFD